ncbi:MAG: NAD-dependent epimerase/dehydratase family protein, partial [Candidatus Odinarchaeia archaeon]
MKKALVCGAGGFIGHHLVKKLKKGGCWVRGVDLKYPEFSETQADDFVIGDLQDPQICRSVVDMKFDEVYQLAADMGGMGFISVAEREVLHNNALINIHISHISAEMNVNRYFFSSSVCIYRDMKPGEPPLSEEDAYPAFPDNEYGWEKLYSERVALTYGRKSEMKVRVARFQNCYGPEGTWTGGREKAPAAICRKVAEAEDGGTIELWGDGSAIRNFIYVDDLVDAVYKLMHSDLEEPVNIGTEEYVSVKQLVDIVSEVAGKKINIKWVPGPVGVISRNFSHNKIRSLGWRPKYSLKEGISVTYP